MVSILNKSGYWGCAILAVLWLLHLASCAQVDQLTSQVSQKRAFDAGNNALAEGDRTSAETHFRKVAQAGHPEAQYNLGLMSTGDDENPGNTAEAVKWMRMSAEQGYAPAQETLGTWYFAGDIAVYNPSEASIWFRKAADQHDDSAMYFLGVLHARGEGVPKDYSTALGWFQMASAKGFPVPPEYLTMDGIAALDREYQSAQISTEKPVVQSRAATVRNVQDGLTQLGYQPGPVDGMMGKKTANAIKAFQRDVNMPVDGKVSDGLMRRIDEKLAN